MAASSRSATTKSSVLHWLLEPANPTARWLTLRLLLDHADDDRDVIEAQRAIPSSPWATAILAGQGADGTWERGKTSRPQLNATMRRLAALAELGMPGDDERIVRACELLLARAELPGEGFCLRQTKPRTPHECGQGTMLYVFNQFGYGADKRVKAALDWLLANQMLDGGWNCGHYPKGRLGADDVIRMDHECSLDKPRHKSSLYSTMAVLKGLAATRRPPKRAIARGVEFILEHRVHRARSSQRAIYRWPPRIEFLGAGYDGLQPLIVLAAAGAKPDARLDEALGYLEGRAVDSRWPADNMSTDVPDKWVTVQAMHVLRTLAPR